MRRPRVVTNGLGGCHQSVVTTSFSSKGGRLRSLTVNAGQSVYLSAFLSLNQFLLVLVEKQEGRGQHGEE